MNRFLYVILAAAVAAVLLGLLGLSLYDGSTHEPTPGAVRDSPDTIIREPAELRSYDGKAIPSDRITTHLKQKIKDDLRLTPESTAALLSTFESVYDATFNNDTDRLADLGEQLGIEFDAVVLDPSGLVWTALTQSVENVAVDVEAISVSDYGTGKLMQASNPLLRPEVGGTLKIRPVPEPRGADDIIDPQAPGVRAVVVAMPGTFHDVDGPSGATVRGTFGIVLATRDGVRWVPVRTFFRQTADEAAEGGTFRTPSLS